MAGTAVPTPSDSLHRNYWIIGGALGLLALAGLIAVPVPPVSLVNDLIASVVSAWLQAGRVYWFRHQTAQRTRVRVSFVSLVAVATTIAWGITNGVLVVLLSATWLALAYWFLGLSLRRGRGVSISRAVIRFLNEEEAPFMTGRRLRMLPKNVLLNLVIPFVVAGYWHLTAVPWLNPAGLMHDYPTLPLSRAAGAFLLVLARLIVGLLFAEIGNIWLVGVLVGSTARPTYLHDAITNFGETTDLIKLEIALFPPVMISIWAVNGWGILVTAMMLYRFQLSILQQDDVIRQGAALALAEKAALTDALTELPNRRAAEEYLTHLAATPHPPVLVGFWDLDRFKRINDTYTHAAGDVVLKAFATFLRAQLTTPAETEYPPLVARWGGEEFLLIWPDVTPQDWGVRLPTTHHALAHLAIPWNPPHGDPVTLHVTASVGYSLWLPHGSLGWADVLQEADDAAYLAKNQGRNRLAAAPSVATRWDVWCSTAGTTPSSAHPHLDSLPWKGECL